MMKARIKAPASSQAGFTLLESLIALLIVSFGLLGIAGLQVITLKSNLSSQHRTLASHYAAEIAERMRTNERGTGPGLLRTPFVAYNAPATSATHPSITTFNPSCKLAGCTEAMQAQNDLAEWQQSIAGAFPSGVGIVCLDSASMPGPNGIGGEPTFNGAVLNPNCDGLGETFMVKIAWMDNRTNETNGATDVRSYLYFNTPISISGF
jgi:type IV pilus assembly protein PilV